MAQQLDAGTVVKTDGCWKKPCRLPEIDLGGDKKLLPSCMHIYGAIYDIVMNSLDMCEAHINVMSKSTLRAWMH